MITFITLSQVTETEYHEATIMTRGEWDAMRPSMRHLYRFLRSRGLPIIGTISNVLSVPTTSVEVALQTANISRTR